MTRAEQVAAALNAWEQAYRFNELEEAGEELARLLRESQPEPNPAVSGKKPCTCSSHQFVQCRGAAGLGEGWYCVRQSQPEPAPCPGCGGNGEIEGGAFTAFPCSKCGGTGKAEPGNPFGLTDAQAEAWDNPGLPQPEPAPEFIRVGGRGMDSVQPEPDAVVSGSYFPVNCAVCGRRRVLTPDGECEKCGHMNQPAAVVGDDACPHCGGPARYCPADDVTPGFTIPCDCITNERRAMLRLRAIRKERDAAVADVARYRQLGIERQDWRSRMGLEYNADVVRLVTERDEARADVARLQTNLDAACTALDTVKARWAGSRATLAAAEQEKEKAVAEENRLARVLSDIADEANDIPSEHYERWARDYARTMIRARAGRNDVQPL